MKPHQQRIIHRAITIFGEKNQTMQAIEELMELQKALFENVHRGTDNVKNITEEVADVEIMLAQIKKIYELDPNMIEQTKDCELILSRRLSIFYAFSKLLSVFFKDLFASLRL